jgi:hypothetical protein
MPKNILIFSDGTGQAGGISFDERRSNVSYARHAISIDENRAAFQRVGWGGAQSDRPEKDGQGIDTFQQFWFAETIRTLAGAMPKTNRGFQTSRLRG